MPTDQICHPQTVGWNPITDDRLVEIKQQITLQFLHHGRIFDAKAVCARPDHSSLAHTPQLNQQRCNGSSLQLFGLLMFIGFAGRAAKLSIFAGLLMLR